jgi:hypothetical protein
MPGIVNVCPGRTSPARPKSPSRPSQLQRPLVSVDVVVAGAAAVASSPAFVVASPPLVPPPAADGAFAPLVLPFTELLAPFGFPFGSAFVEFVEFMEFAELPGFAELPVFVVFDADVPAALSVVPGVVLPAAPVVPGALFADGLPAVPLPAVPVLPVPAAAPPAPLPAVCANTVQGATVRSIARSAAVVVCFMIRTNYRSARAQKHAFPWG